MLYPAPSPRRSLTLVSHNSPIHYQGWFGPLGSVNTCGLYLSKIRSVWLSLIIYYFLMAKIPWSKVYTKIFDSHRFFFPPTQILISLLQGAKAESPGIFIGFKGGCLCNLATFRNSCRLVIDLPLWKIWVRQLGLWHPHIYIYIYIYIYMYNYIYI